jgi:hypothetical protein
VVSIDCLVDASFAVDMSTASDVTIFNLVEADVAQELFLKCSHTYLEVFVL